MELERRNARMVEREDLAEWTTDPVAQLLLSDRAETLREPNELYRLPGTISPDGWRVPDFS
jgi:hypothetical protein